MDPKIIIKNVTKTFKNITVLNDVNLKIHSHETVGFVGRNGTGKSVLLKIISGLMPRDSGMIIVDGMVIGDEKDFPSNMSVLFDFEFLPNYSAFENLKFISSLTKTIDDYTIHQYLNLFGLGDTGKKPYRKFSTGMKQKLKIIQALMENPSLIILDEPFNFLDEESVRLLRKILLDEKEKGKTILITSHNIEDINVLCDRVFQILDSKILELGDELLE